MLGKLLSLVAQAKGAAIATVVVASAATATVGATSPEVQDAISNVTNAVGSTLAAVVPTTSRCVEDGAGAKGDGGQPAVVAQRNAADKLLRDAHQDARKAITELRGGKETDNKAVGDIVKKYDDQLKDTLDTALVKVAALTQGREGQVRKAEASGSAKPRGSQSAKPSGSEKPEGSKSPKPSCSPRPSGSAAAASPKPSESPRGSGSAKPSGSPGKPEDQGRVAVAERTALDADVKAIVDQAILDFASLVKKATDEVALVPAPDRGKPSDKPGNSNKPDDKGKPSEQPGGGRPSGSPGRP